MPILLQVAETARTVSEGADALAGHGGTGVAILLILAGVAVCALFAFVAWKLGLALGMPLVKRMLEAIPLAADVKQALATHEEIPEAIAELKEDVAANEAARQVDVARQDAKQAALDAKLTKALTDLASTVERDIAARHPLPQTG